MTRFHSVRLDTDKCKGCTNCLKHCPTEAIRVRGGRAHIIDERCVDCGECIRICGYHAKVAMTDKLEDIFQFEHRIALPAPTLYGQFRHLSDVGLVLDALLSIGFTGVYEVARGADVATKAIHDRLRQPGRLKPLISSACPTITRIIQVRFPTLIPHIIDVRQPMEIAASLARTEYVRQHGCAPDEVGVFFITPCAAKMTAIRNPIGHERSAINGAIAITDVLNKLLPYVTGAKAPQHHTRATPYAIGWASSGGEVDAAIPRNSMAVDGIDNVIRVLEEVEDGKLNDIDYFEGAACPGGCVGGPLTYANNYLAQNTIATLKKAMPEQHPLKSVTGADMNTVPLYFDRSISQNQSLKLDDNINDALDRMAQMDEIMSRLPGYDCGSCGSPTCRTFAEDIVRGYCTEIDCIHILKNRLKVMAQQMVDLAQNSRE